MPDYNAAIAIAAKEFIAAKRENAITGKPETQNIEARAHEKLDWMIDAERFGWNPDDCKPED